MATCPSCRAHYDDKVRVCEADGEHLLPDSAFDHMDTDLAEGTSVGEYEIEGKLGEGGFGTVYRAMQPVIGKAVAIKVLKREHSANPQMVSRFAAEARAVNQIRHRNIIDIFSFNQLPDGRHYYVMELLEGITLAQLIEERGHVPPEEAIPILRGVARALDAAHAQGIAHRDLKPENVILIDQGDGTLFPKLLDFGIAKLMADGLASHKTRTGAPLGTPAYMSPEQCHAVNVDHRTDIYSFGILVHETLTGKLPFDGATMMEVLLKQTGAPAPSMSSVCAALSPLLDAPVLHMLEKDPDQRAPSIAEAVEALASAIGAAGHAVTGAPVSKSEPRPSGAGQVRIGRSTPGHLTPVDLSLGEARTVATGPTRRTLEGAASDVAPPRGRWVYAGAAVALVLASGAVYWLTTGTPESPVVTVAPIEPTASSAPAGSTTSTGSSTAATPAPVAASNTEVEIEIDSAPEKTRVFMGGNEIGTVPGKLRLARSTEKRKLTLKAAGYKDLDVEVTPDKDRALSVPPMVKIASPSKTGASRKDLENPF